MRLKGKVVAVQWWVKDYKHTVEAPLTWLIDGTTDTDTIGFTYHRDEPDPIGTSRWFEIVVPQETTT